jgi:hypothetical protein
LRIAERDGAILREARPEDLPAIDVLTIEGYAPIQASYVAMLGEETYEAVRHRPELTWEERFDRFRELGLRFAHVDTDLDDAHAPARRAYEAVGFDRQVPVVEYWQDLSKRTPGSMPL